MRGRQESFWALLMSRLVATSDEVLASILALLQAEDIFQLVRVGSTLLTQRVLRNTTDLVWKVRKSTFFPFFVYNFPKLKSLIIQATQGQESFHLSTKERSLLPLEPIKTLQSLELNFVSSSSALSASSAFSSAFPYLTSLVVRSEECNGLEIPASWSESLPDTLLSLTIDLSPSILMRSFNSTVSPSDFDTLPKGLQLLHFKASPIDNGPIKLNRFENLRIARIYGAKSPDSLDYLSESLEEFTFQMLPYITPSAEFPISKLPPKIRIWDVSGVDTPFKFDAMAPLTLEEVSMKWKHSDVTLETLTNFFPSYERLRMLRVGGMGPPPSFIAMLPSIEALSRPQLSTDAEEAARRLPSTQLLTLSLASATTVPRSYKFIPPTVTDFSGPISLPQQISELPKSITKMWLRSEGSPPLPPDVWEGLPSLLQSLSIPIELMTSLKCLSSVPECLEQLTLSTSSLKSLNFPEKILRNLKSLIILYYDEYNNRESPAERRNTEWMTKLGDFMKLETFSIDSSQTLMLRTHTLSNLPKSLTTLELSRIEFENLGMGPGNDAKNPDWENSALSRLPEGLTRLSLQYGLLRPDQIDFMIFSRLPRNLCSFTVHTKQIRCKNPESFISSLPRRLTTLRHHDHSSNIYHNRSKPKDDDIESKLERNRAQYREAMEKYYSDPFWAPDGRKFLALNTDIDKKPPSTS